jgi:hypothetical protein
MSFLHPAIFWGGAAAASVPIIIHLLNRRRYRIMDWAAMRFLYESVRKNRRRVRLEELLLLLLRCLAVVLLALVVGRFMGCSPGQAVTFISTPVQATHVFILDDSVSMGQKLADTTVLSKAANDLADMLGQIPATDQAAVLLTSRPKRAEAFFDLNRLGDAEGLAGRLKSLKPSDTTAQLDKAVKTAAEILKDAKGEKRLYILSDFRRADYAGGRLEELRKELAFLSSPESAKDARSRTQVALLSYGTPAAGNLTIEDIAVLDKLPIAGSTLRVQVRVRNNGPGRAENVAVRFPARTAGGAEMSLPAKVIKEIDPGQTYTLQVNASFPDAGGAVVEAELPGDSLAGDNRAYLALDVRAARRVLLVDGEPDVAEPLNSETFYLLRAMDPSADKSYGNSIDVVPADRLIEMGLDNYDAVIMANVGDLQTPAVQALEKYVRAGGGLAIYTGDRVSRDFYRELYAGGAGLCPVLLGMNVADTARREKYYRLAADSIAEDFVMRSFQGKRANFTKLVRFFGLSLVEEIAPAAPSSGLAPARVLARFDNSDTNPANTPAIVARSYGSGTSAGTVMAILSSADKEWTDWPKDFTFVPFVNDMLDYISRAGGLDYTALVGRPITYVAGADLMGATARLQTPAFPAEDEQTLAGSQQAAGRLISYDDTHHAGIYPLKLELPGETRTVLFARNVDPIEGRLEVASEQELRGFLGVDFHYVDKLGSGPAVAGIVQPKREYWKAALAALLVVLALEVFLGQRFGHYS